MIIAGESSGDLHAAFLVKELKGLKPSLSFSGLGGPQMAASGVEIFADLTKNAVVGFTEVVKHYPYFQKLFKEFLAKVRERKPAAVILVDYPGFNLRMAAQLKKLGIKVIYYISPQVWAWKESRVRAIKKLVDKMIVIFPFEKDFYARHGMEVVFVGHPLFDEIKSTRPPNEFLTYSGLYSDRFTIGILPGSRQKEVERHLPIMLEAAKMMCGEFARLQFLVLRAPVIDMLFMEGLFRPYTKLPIRITSDTYNALNACQICMVASGTATLETALFEKPLVVVYKTSFFTYFLARLFIKIPYIGLVNVVAGKKIVPELIQNEVRPGRLVEELRPMYSDEIRIAQIKEELKKMRQSLGEPGASRRAAQEVMKTLAL